MSKPPPLTDHEINLSVLIENLWNGKRLIISSVVLASLVGFGFSQAPQPQLYKVNISYETSKFVTNLICNEDGKCKRLILPAFMDWETTRKHDVTSLSLSTSTPLDVTEYEAQFKLANEILTDKMYNEAKTEVDFLNAEMPENLLNSEYGFEYKLNHKRLISSIDDGKSVLTLVSASVSDMPLESEVARNLAISAILGGLFSSFIVHIRSEFRKRKKQITKT